MALLRLFVANIYWLPVGPRCCPHGRPDVNLVLPRRCGFPAERLAENLGVGPDKGQNQALLIGAHAGQRAFVNHLVSVDKYFRDKSVGEGVDTVLQSVPTRGIYSNYGKTIHELREEIGGTIHNFGYDLHTWNSTIFRRQNLTLKPRRNGLSLTYNSMKIVASDRWLFEAAFDRDANYAPQEIVRITYGKKTLYQA